MGIELSAVLFIPVLFALIGCLLPGRLARFASIAGSALVLAHAAVLVAGFNHSAGAPALQHVTDVSWIPQLGIRWSLGLDGLNILLIALTALLWLVGTIAAARTDLDRPKLFYLMLGLAE